MGCNCGSRKRTVKVPKPRSKTAIKAPKPRKK